jgi:hypothetical protein
MIVFDLVCEAAHRFEAWFDSSRDYEDQATKGQIACPVCNSITVGKAVMAPAVSAKSNQKHPTQSLTNDDVMAQLLLMQRAFEANSDYVGNRFAAEARAIHERGEARSIHGEATADEISALQDDGVPLLPLPFRPRAGSDA